jgi:branched-chain amino acid transport system substrate-binding protein
MKKKPLFLTALILLVASIIGSAIYYQRLQNQTFVNIAVVGPMSGSSAALGRSFIEGAQMYVDTLNQQGGINGKPVRLIVYDDLGEPKNARMVALEITQRKDILAVIGHRYSSTSNAVRDIYNNASMLALTPTSTHIDVTKDAPWYFRVIYNNQQQARYLANYIRHVMGHDTAAIVTHTKAYGMYLADQFSEAADEVGLRITRRFEFDTQDPHLDNSLNSIARQLRRMRTTDIILLATHVPEGVELVKKIKENKIRTPLIGPNSYANRAFPDGFNQYPREQELPGHYSDGIVVASPLIFDTAGESAHVFREDFKERYGRSPSWDHAYAYDAMMLIGEGLKTVKASGNPEKLIEDRAKLRAHLAMLNSPEEAIEGATGLNYFNDQRDAQRSIAIAMYTRQHLISNHTQLRIIQNYNEISDLQASIAAGNIIKIDQNYMYKTTVVYTGVELKKISNFDWGNLTYDLEFLIWFRYANPDIDPANIEFLNALEPLRLGEPLKDYQKDDMYYKLYKVKGRFQGDLKNTYSSLRSKRISLSFRHHEASHKELAYISDVLGMGTNDDEELAKRQSDALSSGSGWSLASLRFYQDVTYRSTLGSPSNLNLQQGKIHFSRFNLDIELGKIEFSFRGLLTYHYAVYLAPLSILMLLMGRQYKRLLNIPNARHVWFWAVLWSAIFLLSAEVVLLQHLGKYLHYQNLVLFITAFSILWWYIGAILVVKALHYFFWHPLEQRTQQKLPTLVRRFAAFIIYMLAFFGIVAFVFDQKLTGLLATSGMAAMIMGLAIQMNLSNIFSGLALNLERPFRVNDWVQIGGMSEGRVTDMNWRTTKVLTRSGNTLNIPNSKVAEMSIENYNTPAQAYSHGCDVVVHPHHDPVYIKKILLKAVMESSDDVLKDPPPVVIFLGVGNVGAEYKVAFTSTNYLRRFAIRDEVWQLVWRKLDEVGVTPAAQRHEVLLGRLEEHEIDPLHDKYRSSHLSEDDGEME